MNRLFQDLNFKVYTSPIEKAGHSGERRLIRGYASVGDVLDRQNEVITLGALIKAREDLLKNHTIFYEHKHSELPIGKTIAVDIDKKGLLITVEISKGSHADSVWTLIEEGILNSFSIGGRVLEAEERRDKNGDLFNEITRIELFETSVVGLPANPAAKFELVSKSFSMAITEEMRKRRNSDMSEKKDEVKKETKEISNGTLDVSETDSTSFTTTSDASTGTSNESAKVVTKSEEKETEKSEEPSKEKETEKSEESTKEKEEVSEEKKETETVEKSEESTKEKEVEKVVEEKSFHGDLSEDKIQMVADAVASISEASDIQASVIWEALSTIHGSTENIENSEKSENESQEEVIPEVEKSEETASKENSSEKESKEELPKEKSFDEQILETLGQIVEKLDKKKEVKEEATTSKETSEEKPAEEVKEEALAEVVVAKSEDTSEKAKEKDIKKVVKVEVKETSKEEVTKKKETPARKGEVILAETPYSDEQGSTKVDEKLLKKIRDLKWCQYMWGK